MKVTIGSLLDIIRNNLLSEEVHAFHGFEFGPEMLGLPGPEFDDEQRVTEEDVDDAETWLNMYDPSELVAFSRGSAVLHQTLQDNPEMYQEVPPVTYISPAALRQWTDAGIPHAPPGSKVIHSIGDNIVPLKQGCQVAAQSGAPMIATPGKGDGKDHVRALKYRTSPGGVEIDPSMCAADPVLPDWGKTNYASQEELVTQMQRGTEMMSIPMLRQFIHEVLSHDNLPDLVMFSGTLNEMIVNLLYSDAARSQINVMPAEDEVAIVLDSGDLFSNYETLNEVHLGIRVNDEGYGEVEAYYTCVPENRAESNLVIVVDLPRNYDDTHERWLQIELEDALSHELQHSCELTDVLAGDIPEGEEKWESLDHIYRHYGSDAETRGYIAGFIGRSRMSGEDVEDIINNYITSSIFQKGLDRGYSVEDLSQIMRKIAHKWSNYYSNMR